jgi:hypothetical protein
VAAFHDLRFRSSCSILAGSGTGGRLQCSAAAHICAHWSNHFLNAYHNLFRELVTSVSTCTCCLLQLQAVPAPWGRLALPCISTLNHGD